jgi:hypothetical protein
VNSFSGVILLKLFTSPRTKMSSFAFAASEKPIFEVVAPVMSSSGSSRVYVVSETPLELIVEPVMSSSGSAAAGLPPDPVQVSSMFIFLK